MVKVTFYWGDWANPEGLAPIPSWSLEAGGLVTQNTNYPLKELDRALHTIEQFFLESERRRCIPGHDTLRKEWQPGVASGGYPGGPALNLQDGAKGV